MDSSNYVALSLGGIGFIISIIGLIITPNLSLKAKRLERRLEYRFLLFQKIVELWEHTHQKEENHDFKPFLLEINKLIQLYGHESEIKSFRELGNSYNAYVENINKTETDRKILITKFNNFLTTSMNTYREEIALGKLPNT